MAEKQYKVCVACPTYNQSRFIEQTMDALCLQQTTFPFVCCILDDASTDGQQTVISRYLQQHFETDSITEACLRETDYAQIRIARHKANRNCLFVVILLHENHFQQGLAAQEYGYMFEWLDQSEYMAVCDGDDYWTSSDKLQQQTDFLDRHPDYALCYSPVIELDSKTGQQKQQNSEPSLPSTITIAELSLENVIPTSTVLFRYESSYIKNLILLKELPMYDYPIWLQAAERGKLYRFDQPLAVYRVGTGSWSSTSMAYRLLKVIEMLRALPRIIKSPVALQGFERQIEVQKTKLIDLFEQLENDRQNVRKEYDHVVTMYREQCSRLSVQERILSSRSYRLARYLNSIFDRIRKI